jgi:phosphatidylglycerophosphate synthase
LPAEWGLRFPDAAADAHGEGADLDGVLRRLGAGGVLHDVDPGGGVALRVSDDAQARAAERRIVAVAGNVRDGRLDRWINRRFSRSLTLLLARTSLHPNHVTLIATAVGILGATLIAVGGYGARIAGVLVFQLAAVLDCCDGELARLRLRESTAGHRLDVTGDTIAHAALFLGIGAAAWRAGAPHAPALGLLLALGALLAFPCVSHAEQTAEARARIGGRLNATIDGLVGMLTTRDYQGLVGVLVLLDRLQWFLAGAAVGAHLFWSVLLALLVIERRRRGLS